MPVILKSAFALLCLVSAALAPEAAPAVETVRIGTAPKVAGTMDGMDAVIGAVNASSALTGVEASEVETGGSIDNLRRLERGQIDAATVSRHSLGLAADPGGREAGADRLAILGVYSISPQDVYVRADSGIEVLGELNGKPFIAGGAGTGTERTTMAVFKALGIKPIWVRVAMDQIPGTIASGEAVGFVKSGTAEGPDRLVAETGEATPLKALALPVGQMALLAKRVAGIVEWPAGDRKGKAITWADPVLVVCLRSLPDSSARAVAAALLDTDTRPNGFDRRAAAASYGQPLHPAAAQVVAERDAGASRP